MPKRSEKRDTAKADYLAQLSKGEKVNLRELADKVGVSYQTIRNWKAADKWDDYIPKRKRGGQPGNTNSKGHKNAKGSHDGAPKGNKNAEKDGAYSAIFFDMLTDAEKELCEKTPCGSREALEHELQILKLREHKILSKIAEYEAMKDDELITSSLLDMRLPKKGKDGAVQQMGMYTKDSAFQRVLKLDEALYKVQGRIATIANSLKAIEETEKRLAIDRRRLDIMYMRASDTFEIEDPAEEMFDDMTEAEDETIYE